MKKSGYTTGAEKFSQRKYTNGKSTYEIVYNIISHKRYPN